MMSGVASVSLTIASSTPLMIQSQCKVKPSGGAVFCWADSYPAGSRKGILRFGFGVSSGQMRGAKKAVL